MNVGFLDFHCIKNNKLTFYLMLFNVHFAQQEDSALEELLSLSDELAASLPEATKITRTHVCDALSKNPRTADLLRRRLNANFSTPDGRLAGRVIAQLLVGLKNVSREKYREVEAAIKEIFPNSPTFQSFLLHFYPTRITGDVVDALYAINKKQKKLQGEPPRKRSKGSGLVAKVARASPSIDPAEVVAAVDDLKDPALQVDDVRVDWPASSKARFAAGFRIEDYPVLSQELGYELVSFIFIIFARSSFANLHTYNVHCGVNSFYLLPLSSSITIQNSRPLTYM